MDGSLRPRRAYGLVVAALAALALLALLGAPGTVAQIGENQTGDFRAEFVTPHLDGLRDGNNPWANRAEFVGTEFNPDVTSWLELEQECFNGCGQNLSVYLDITPKDSGATATVTGQKCWNYETPPQNTEWEESSTGFHVSDPGEVEIVAHVNDEEAYDNCKYNQTITEQNDTVEVSPDNTANFTVVAGERPDLAREGPIKWCWYEKPGVAGAPANTSQDPHCPTGHAVNASNTSTVHPYEGGASETVFRVNVENLGTYNTTNAITPLEVNSSWGDGDAPAGEGEDPDYDGADIQGLFNPNADKGGENKTLSYKLNVSVRNPVTDNTEYLSRDWIRGASNPDWFLHYLGQVSSKPWNLSELSMAGPREVTIAIDEPENRLREVDENNTVSSDDLESFDVFIYGSDLTGQINRSAINTSVENAYSYPPQGEEETINVSASLSNVGTIAAEKDVVVDVVLHPGDDQERTLVADQVFTAPFDPGETRNLSFQIDYCQNTDQEDLPCELRPGEHPIEMRVDTADDQNIEEDEFNNTDVVTFFTEDADAPTVESLDRYPAQDPARLGRGLTFSAILTEQDPSFGDDGNVTLHLDLPGDGAVQNLSMSGANIADSEWNFTRDVSGDVFDEEGTYSWWVTGSDPSENAFSTAADPETFEVASWPKTIADISPEPGFTLDWNEDPPQPIEFNATINGTGLDGEAQGKWVNVTQPDGVEDQYNLTPVEGPEDLYANDSLTFVGETMVTPPGRWNFTVAVQDKAGVWKEVNRSFRIQDTPPRIDNVSMSPSDGDALSLSSITFTANVTDPDGDQYESFPGSPTGVRGVHLNITHEDGDYTRNVSLTFDSGDQRTSTWKGEILTGFKAGEDRALPLAGTYNYTVEVADKPRNWNASDHGDLPGATRFRVFDRSGEEGNPDIESSSADPPREETNEPVTFTAVVKDDTQVTVDLSITDSNGNDACQTLDLDCTMERVPDTNEFRRTLRFSNPGTYTWQVNVQDSAGNQASTSASELVIDPNLPPRMDVFAPSAGAGDGTTYYTDPKPDFGVSIQDPSGIDGDSISLSVEGEPVNLTQDNLLPITNPNLQPGYNLTYSFRNRYNHSDEIRVAVSAQDTSDANRTKNTAFKLVVDGKAPGTDIGRFTPRSRAGGFIWNVSKQTTFPLSAADNGQVRSGIDTTFYRLEKEVQGQRHEYDGPFRLNESRFPAALQGPGLYTLTYWSVDRAGNQERPRSIQVNLDLDGPDIDYVEKGRFVNATVSDPHTVSEVNLHYKKLEEEEFTTETMEFEQPFYRATLPDIPQGETIEYFISATDGLGNTNRLTQGGSPFLYEPGNSAPSVSWQTPTDGATLSDTVTLRWTASDPDPDTELSYSLEYKLVDEPATAYETLASVSGTSLTYDTTQIPDGKYDLRVTVRDDDETNTKETTSVIQVEIDNAEAPATPNELSDTNFRLGEPVTFTSRVNQAADEVVLVVTRNEEEVARTPMRDDGVEPDAQADDNIYSASQQFNASGQYSWHVEISYQQDGQTVTEDSSSGQTFQVEATASQVFERNLGLWVAIVVLTAAAVGVGWYGLRNHQQGP
jgi:hypothetical protein